jgi:hypothetical protein
MGTEHRTGAEPEPQFAAMSGVLGFLGHEV